MSLFKRRGTRIASSGRQQQQQQQHGSIFTVLSLVCAGYLLFGLPSNARYSTSFSSVQLGSSDLKSGVSLKVSSIVPDACPVQMNTSLFDLTYQKGFWDIPVQQPADFYLNGGLPQIRRKHSRKSSSGSGSALGIRTETSLTFLREVIANYSIHTMIDLACGDANWIFDSWETDSIALYVGLDVAAPVVALNQDRFGHHSNKIFRHWNGYECGALPQHFLNTESLSTLPYGETISRPFDLIHARDVIQHVKKENGVRMLCNIFESKASMFITTSYLNETENRELGSTEGRLFQPYNFDLPPFDFGEAKSCRMTHPDKHELDFTCVYDLRKPWVALFLKTKC
jgi:hypothetical protein